MAPHSSTLPGKFHGWRSLVGCSPWGRWESDTTERLHCDFSLSCIGEGNGSPLQCSCLENPRDGGAWWAAVCGVAQSRTRLERLNSSSSSNRCVVVPCFNLHFPDKILCEPFFFNAHLPSYMFFGQVFVKTFGSLFNWVVFLLLSFKHSAYMWIRVLYQVCLLQIFYSSLWLVFSFFGYCLPQSSF